MHLLFMVHLFEFLDAIAYSLSDAYLYVICMSINIHTSDICERLNQAQIGPSNLDYSAISAYVLSIMR